MKQLWTSCVIMGLLLAGSACQTDQLSIDEKPCPAELACTEVFVMVNLQIRDADGKPVLLDSYITRNTENGKIYQFDQEQPAQAGTYIILSDAQLADVHKEGSRFEFTGMRNGQLVVQEDYRIGHDCCHIQLLEGKTAVQIGAR